MTETTTKTRAYMVRCAGCKVVKRVDLPMIRRMVYPSPGAFGAIQPQIRTMTDPTAMGRWLTANPCPCGSDRGREIKPVQGRRKESVKCGAKCLGAIGPSCDCSCGGENHGRWHA